MNKATQRIAAVLAAVIIGALALLPSTPVQAGAPSGNITNVSDTWLEVQCWGYNNQPKQYYLTGGVNSATSCQYVTYIRVVAGGRVRCSTDPAGPFTDKWTTVGWNYWPGTNHLWCKWMSW